MLNRRPRNKRARAKALTDPRPEFVSLVDAGANKTPFRALRRANQPPQNTAEPLELAQRGGYLVARIDFDSEHFTSENQVRAWLQQGGYEDAKVSRTAHGFAATGGDVPGDTTLNQIEGKGFTMHVAEAGDAQVSRTQKAYASARDLCESLESAWDDSKSVKEVLAQTKHSPPGLMDMTMAMYDAMRNSMRAGDTIAAKAAIAEFAGLFDELLEIFPGDHQPSMKALVDALAPEVEMTQETIEAVKAEEEAELAASKDVGVAEAEASADPDAEDAEKGMGKKRPYKGGKDRMKEDEDEDAETSEKEDDAESEGGEVAEADAETSEKEEESEDDGAEEAAAKSGDEASIAALTVLVGNLTQSMAELAETVSKSTKASDELAQRVEAVEGSRQTRKGADVGETTTSSKSGDRDLSTDMAELRKRSMLGMRG